MKLLDLGVYDVQRNESGQSIVLIALLIIGLIAFAGIATDVGMLFARSSQFTAAVDAAALAGVVDLTGPTEEIRVSNAITRSAEFLMANRWPTDQIAGAESTTGRGYPEFILTATYSVPTYFLRVLGFEEIPVTRSAAAALYTQTDMPTATQAQLGMLRTAGQFVMGPDSCTAQGDPISARWRDPGVINPFRDFTGGRYTYRIQVPSDFDDALEVQLFDPDSLNARVEPTAVVRFSTGEDPEERACFATGGPGDACMMPADPDVEANPVWLHRVDETWEAWTAPSSGCPAPYAGEPSGNTVTRYVLYYFDSDDQREDIASFTTGPSTDLDTDLKWVTPGAATPGVSVDWTGSVTGTFRVANGDLDDIPLDGSDYRSVYLDVETIAGTSKNGWDVWAGPTGTVIEGSGLPADGNDRNLAIIADPGSVSNGGVEVFAQGYLPVTAYRFGALQNLPLPLAAVSSAEGGGRLYATGFDFELLGGDFFQFSFSTMALCDRPGVDEISCVPLEISEGVDQGFPDNLLGYKRYAICEGGADCNNKWVEPQFDILIPSNTSAHDPTPFYGGYLTVAYTIAGDEHVWSVTLHGGRPFLTR